MNQTQAESGPCLKLAEIEGVITDTAYHVFPGSTVTVCMLTLANGAKVVGTNYGAIDTTQQDWEKGQADARQEAVNKAWELEGYLLRQRLLDVQPTLI